MDFLNQKRLPKIVFSQTSILGSALMSHTTSTEISVLTKATISWSFLKYAILNSAMQLLEKLASLKNKLKQH